MHESKLNDLLPSISLSLIKNKNSVKLHLDEVSYSTLINHDETKNYEKNLIKSNDEDFEMEWLDYELSVKVVKNINEAINHVNSHGSHHTDSIVTENSDNKNLWLKGVDSAGVYVNASTRFADGFRYGFGAEFGVATGKTHARGPVGLEGLVIYKYILKSKNENGHIVGEFGENGKKFKHSLIKDGKPWY